MTIRSIDLIHVAVPLKKPIRHASHERTTSDNLVVRVRLDDGVLGYGEGVPRSYVTGETIESTFEALSSTDWTRHLGRPGGFAEVVKGLEALTLPETLADPRGMAGNSARCALELAILDAYGRRFGASVGDAVRLVEAPGLGQTDEPQRVRYSGAITAESGRRERVAAWKMRLYGFAQVKLKVGVAGQDDPARLARLRSILGRRMDLRIDANEAWPAAEVVERVRPLLRFGPSALEQPVPHAEADALAGLRAELGVPVMLDESLCGYPDATRSIELGTADLFNVRLSKCGGIVPSLKLMGLAARHGLGVQLGCHPGETGLLSAAGRHVAANVRGIRYLEGSYDRHILAENLAVEDITFRYGGWAPPLAGPGLGVSVDPAALERMTVVRKEISYEIEARAEIQAASDGYAIHNLVWPAAGGLKGRVVVLHGIQSHGGWYHSLGRTLAGAGYEAHFPDRRGSGANRADRGHAPSSRRLLADLAERLQALRALDPARPIALAGISWGGKLAVIAAAEQPRLVDALALICPGIHPQVGVSSRERLRIALAYLANRRRTFPIPLSDPALFTAGPEGQAFISSDNLSLHAGTAGLLAASVFLDRKVRKVPPRVRAPALLMLAGQDLIVNNALTLGYFESLASLDRHLIVYPEAHHTLEFEADPSRYALDLVDWLNSRLVANVVGSERVGS